MLSAKYCGNCALSHLFEILYSFQRTTTQVSRIVPSKSPHFPAFARSRRQEKLQSQRVAQQKHGAVCSCADDSIVVWNGDDNDDDDNVGDNKNRHSKHTDEDIAFNDDGSGNCRRVAGVLRHNALPQVLVASHVVVVGKGAVAVFEVAVVTISFYARAHESSTIRVVVI